MATFNVLLEYLLLEGTEKEKYMKLLQFIDLQKDSTDPGIKNTVSNAKLRLVEMQKKYPYLKKLKLKANHYKRSAPPPPGGGRRRWTGGAGSNYRYSGRSQAKVTAIIDLSFFAIILTTVLVRLRNEARAETQRVCGHLKGDKKKICLLLVIIKGKQKELKYLNSRKKGCKNTSKPEKCLKYINKLIVKKEQSINKYKDKLSKLKG